MGEKSDNLNNMTIKAFAVIDTNVIVSALTSSLEESAVSKVADLIDSKTIIPLYDERILSEYYEVLNYKKFGFLPEVVEKQMTKILSKGIFVSDVKQIDICFKDETDIPFFEVMMDTQELGSSLVTGNIKHYPEGSCVTPQQLLSNLAYMENFVVPLKHTDYENMVEEKILQLTSTGKYFLGNLLPKEFIKEIKKQRLKPREHISISDYVK